jgi:hypothetical protein
MPRRDRDRTLLDCKMPDEQPHEPISPAVFIGRTYPRGAEEIEQRCVYRQRPESYPNERVTAGDLKGLNRPYMRFRRRGA